MAAYPKNGMMPCTSTATMTRMTLAGSAGEKPALIISTSPAPTMRMSPSTSKPIWVIQLKNEMGLPPFGPKAARLMANTVVPLCGPWSEHSPRRK